MKRLLIAAAALALVAAACTDSAEETTTTVPPTTTLAITTTMPPATTTTAPAPTTTTTAPPTTTTAPSVVTDVSFALEPFGTFQAIPLLDDSTPYGGPATPSSLRGVTVHEPVQPAFDDPGVRAMLVDQGFVVVPGEARLFHHVYGYDEYFPFPVFVTTDTAYHVWHLAFDKALRDAEEGFLLPALDRLVLGLVERARAQRDQFAGTALADAADRVAQFYEAAATVLELDVGPIGDLARAEVALIGEHAQFVPSPTTGAKVNYPLFKPRGHYTRSADLERFFRGMSVLGQGAFSMEAESLRLGLLAARVLLNDEEAVADWQLIYEPTAFLVGAADDYTPFELAQVAAAAVPGGLDDPAVFADAAAVADIANRLQAMRPVLINPDTASARIMGVRFTLDSFIIDQLVIPNVAERFVTSVRDVAAAFGSEWALASLVDDDYTAYVRYDGQLAAMRDLVATRDAADWSRTVYDAWLYAIAPMWSPHGAAFPDFMQTDAWAAKAHQTGFASYAELKHDTILYTKQAIAEGGNGGEPPPPPRHWVEPDPVAYERIGAAARLLREGLEARDLIDDGNAETLAFIEEEMAFLARIARDELAGVPIDEEDNQRLQWFGGWLELIWLNTSDLDSIGEDGGPDEDAALIADIMLSITEGALEVGTGKIDRIYVIVPDDAGGFQVAMGGVYSFYEFWQDPSNRLSDEEWRVLLDAGQAPDRPSWTEAFLLGG